MEAANRSEEALPNSVEVHEHRYSHPCHYLPHESRGVWRVSRSLLWGYEYLAISNTILALVPGRNPSSTLDFGCGDRRLLYEHSEIFQVGSSESTVPVVHCPWPEV